MAAEKPQSIKQLLLQSLGAVTADESAPKLLSLPASEDLRSRTNSLRNGETSKVIETLDIEQPKMEKEQIEEYLRFKALKQQSSSSGVAPRDRQLSQEFFKEEAKRLDKELQEGRHLRKQPSSKATSEPEPLPQKRFTCFKAKSLLLKQDTVACSFGLHAKIQIDF